MQYFIFVIPELAKNHESRDFHCLIHESAFSTERIFHAECMETQAVTPRDIWYLTLRSYDFIFVLRVDPDECLPISSSGLSRVVVSPMDCPIYRSVRPSPTWSVHVDGRTYQAQRASGSGDLSVLALAEISFLLALVPLFRLRASAGFLPFCKEGSAAGRWPCQHGNPLSTHPLSYLVTPATSPMQISSDRARLGPSAPPRREDFKLTEPPIAIARPHLRWVGNWIGWWMLSRRARNFSRVCLYTHTRE